LIFFFALPVSSGKFGKQFLRFRVAKTFFLGIVVFLYQNKNPVAHLGLGRQFCASLKKARAKDKIYRSVGAMKE
jgi:hypothetical protein